MIVYWEYAFAENFLLDGLLLYLALKCARTKVYRLNLVLAAAVGAAEAVVFPLIYLPVWAAYLVKIAGGILICVIGLRKAPFKSYLITTAAFFLMTFALGGCLTAVYSFFGVQTEKGNGFLIERAPVGLVFAVSGIFCILLAQGIKFFFRYQKIRRTVLGCKLRSGAREVKWKCLPDSGNLLTFRGEPVSVLSAAAVFALFGRSPKQIGRITVNTVNGGRDSPVFSCDALELEIGGTTIIKENVLLTVGEVRSKEYQMILHTSLTEGIYENSEHTQKLAGKNKGKRKRSTLSLRK